MDKNTQQVMFSSKSKEWGTPQHFFDKLNKRFGPFTLDPCANSSNYKVVKHFTADENGLEQDWGGHVVFMNPPYGRGIKEWIKKAYEESRKEDTTVVMLIPARTDTRYWHDYVMKANDLYFVKGRLKFGNGENSAPFPSAVVVFENTPRNAYLDFPRIGVM
jgi:site-specific DNA-methyltransferase (adenine-specific)|tara:strand:+ start:255 stop:737 length:483 start_codon:yes stop_codon:yes gene_type:complete